MNFYDIAIKGSTVGLPVINISHLFHETSPTLQLILAILSLFKFQIMEMLTIQTYSFSDSQISLLPVNTLKDWNQMKNAREAGVLIFAIYPECLLTDLPNCSM